ncbi:MAG TPA: protein kinase [Kofleriaceae bacterium]|jgi:WD40 repeat protein/serine/threonine protein kinase|nr:protein kinase [Kofleriaceae bacterium]
MEDHDLCGQTLGGFILQDRIGGGGGGIVYRCFQPSLQRHAVIKVLREPTKHNSGARERFLREAQLASRLDHHYAAHVYGFGPGPGDVLWIAMELVHGITLEKWLLLHGPMSIEQFVPFFACIAEVVAAAHERGIVHRDLKPANVMVIMRGGRLIPKLLDFGIAKANHETTSLAPLGSCDEPGDVPPADGPVTRTDPSERDWHLTPSNVGIGSSPYMSPEQWDDARTVGPAADIYSLGVLAYQALTGRLPFTAQSERGWYEQHLRAKVPPLGGDISPAFDRVIQRPLAKAPEDRYASVLEFGADLQEALRASERELLRSSAQQWAARARAPGLLWGVDVLSEVDRWTRRAPSGTLSALECSFVAECWRRVRRFAWLRRVRVAAVVMIALSAVAYWSLLRARTAEDMVTQSEREQGQQAVLHGELGDARLHLAEAYRRGDHSDSTSFMLSRALEPRRAELMQLTSTAGRMWSAMFSPDGRQIVTTDDRSAQIWDAATGRRRYLLPHPDTVFHAAYSADGAMLATAGGDGAVRLWNAASGERLRELTREGKRLRYYIAAMSSDRRFVAAITMTGDITDVWSADTGALLAELRNADALEHSSLAFSADSRWLATSGGGTASLIDTTSWKLVRTFGSHVRSLGFDPRGSRLAIGTGGGDVAVWDIGNHERVHHLREVGDTVDLIAWSPDGELVVAASHDGTEQVFDAASGSLRSQGNYLHGAIRSVEFDVTSSLVLAAGASGSVVVADVRVGTPLAVLEGSQSVVTMAHFDPNGRRVVGASWDGTARVWDATPSYRRWSSPPISDECGVATSLEPDRRFVAVGCEGHPTRVWDTAHDLLLAELPSMPASDGDFAPALPAVSAAGDRAAVARGDAVEVYELPGGALLHTVNHGAAVTAVAFAASGRDLVSGGADGSVLITHDTGAKVALPLSTGGIDAAKILPDGRVVVADASKHLRVYALDGATLANLSLPTRVGLLRASQDGRRLVTIPSYLGETASPMLWDIEHYQLRSMLDGHIGRVFSARFSPDDREILTAGGDGTARSWASDTGRLRTTYRGGTRYLTDATLTPDGSMVVGGGVDGLLRYWDAASGRELWRLLAHKAPVVAIHFEGADVVSRGFGGDIARWTVPGTQNLEEFSTAAMR